MRKNVVYVERDGVRFLSHRYVSTELLTQTTPLPEFLEKITKFMENGDPADFEIKVEINDYGGDDCEASIRVNGYIPRTEAEISVEVERSKLYRVQEAERVKLQQERMKENDLSELLRLAQKLNYQIVAQ